MKETERERVAREAREFRENETRRIAAEKEEARKAVELRKQLERERIALESGKFLKDAVKEQAALTRIKELEKQLQRQGKLDVVSGVSEKAEMLSVREGLERQRAEEERIAKEKRRSPQKSGSFVSDTSSLGTFSAEDMQEDDDLDGGRMSRRSTMYYDAEMSQSYFEKDSDIVDYDQNSNEAVRGLKKRESVYYDANEAPSQTISVADSVAIGPTTEDVTASPKSPSFLVKDSGEDEMEGPKNDFEVDENAAGAQARAIFLQQDDDYVGIPSSEADAAGGLPESIVKRQQRPHLRRKKTRDKGGEDNMLVQCRRRQEACYEIPIEYNAADGSFKIGQDAELSMSTSIAPSHVDGRWSGSIEGRATAGPSATMGQTSGSLSLDYSVNRWSRLSMGMIRGHELFHPLITLGGFLLRHGSIIGVTFYHNASFLHSMLLEHSMYSIMFQHNFRNSRWSFSSELSRRQEVSLAISNTKIKSSVSWSLRKLKSTTIRVDLCPRLGKGRTAHVFGEFRSIGVWQVGASLMQSLHSSMATVGLGIRIYSTRGLEWMLSWSRGESTVRIPVLLSSGIASMRIEQVLYFSMLSFLIQEGIAEIWGWKYTNAQQESNQRSERSALPMSTTKTRHNAEIQQGLMSRQAKRKFQNEIDKEGLVIHSAKYAVDGGDTWDVTVPLQFWVNQSSLVLPSNPKSRLLGFYDISVKDPNTREDTDREVGKTSAGFVAWWEDLLFDTSDGAVERPDSTPSPKLQVHYSFQNESFQITILDDDELVLPNPKAKKISK